MSEIKPVLDEGLKACEELFERDYFGNHNVKIEELVAIRERFCKAAAAYEALQKENAELKEDLQSFMSLENSINERGEGSTLADLTESNAAQAKRIAHQQYLIDTLMIEYCPDEMTEEQWEDWKAHQRRVTL